MGRRADPELPAAPATLVPRPAVRDALARAAAHPLTLLIAPAGSGKTTALLAFAHSPGAPRIRWLGAPLGDGLTELAGALLLAADPSLTRAVRDPDQLVRRLARAGSGPPDVVVVDDAHLLPRPAWQLLDAVLTRVPDQVRIVLAARRDTPLPLVALGLTGSATVLRSSTLRFEGRETAQLVRHHAPDATAEDVLTLQEHTGGWAAALVLGARTLGAATDRDAARDGLARTDQPVLDYLLGEVFETLPAATRRVLLSTFDEDSVTMEVAVLLSDDPAAAERLTALATDGLLVVQVPSGASGGPARWRYHPLLRELLRREAAGRGAGHRVAAAAHERAARHYATAGPPEAAVRHATATPGSDLLIGLLIEHGPRLLLAVQDEVLDAALAALPDDATEHSPGLLAVMAMHRGNAGDFDAATWLADRAIRAAGEARLRLLERSKARTVAPEDVALVADAALLVLYRARWGWADPAEAIQGAREALGWAVGPARETWLRQELSTIETWVGDFPAARQDADAAVASARLLGSGYDRLLAAGLANVALLAVLEERDGDATTAATECLAVAGRAGRGDDAYLSRAKLSLAWVAQRAGRPDLVAGSLAEVEALDADPLDPLVRTMSTLLRADVLGAAGRGSDAAQLLDSFSPTLEPVPEYLLKLLADARAHWLPRPRSGDGTTPALTDRETDVLRELALGGSYLDVARALYVTENTVKTHVASLYRKLDADRRATALRRARETGLI